MTFIYTGNKHLSHQNEVAQQHFLEVCTYMLLLMCTS
jgi:hypothetical protein